MATLTTMEQATQEVKGANGIWSTLEYQEEATLVASEDHRELVI